METDALVAALSAVGQATRLKVLEALAAEPSGVSAGRLASIVGTPANTLSSHLAILERVGLVGRERRGRVVTFRLSTEALHDVAARIADIARSR